jgi:creatinine amidohydrolase
MRVSKTMRKGFGLATAMMVAAMGLGSPGLAQPASSSAAAAPAMRSRLLTTLTGYEVEQYLKRNDVIYIPVGPTETNGGSPTDVEYVIPLAYALKLAEKSDGLVLPYLAFFYPGGTTTSRATIYVSTSDSLPYLKALTRSLIRQGFRRIIFLTSHGPSGNTMLPLVRETFDELHVPVMWMDTGMIRPTPPPGAGRPQRPDPFGGEGGENSRQLVTYGAYRAAGRLNDLPVGLTEPKREIARDPSNLSRFVPPFNGTPAGSFYGDPAEHGGFVTAVTAEQREEWGRKGETLLDSQVAAFDANGMLDALRKRDQFTRQLEKKYGDLLPGNGK